ncbi:uncharacterized protein TM35_000122850, partial [Trypanosoma theileri]
MTKKMDSRKYSFNENIAVFMATESNCRKALNRTKNATDNAREVGELLKPLLEEIRKTENLEKKNESKELLKKAVDAAKEAEEAANNAKLIATATMDLVSSMQRVTKELHVLVKEVKETATEHIEKKETKKMAEECMEKAGELERTVTGAEYAIPSANEVAKKTEKQAKDASDAAVRLQPMIDEIFKKYPQIKEEVDREIKERAQANANPTNTGSEGNKTPNENKESNGTFPTKQNEENTRNQNTNTAQTETGSHTTAQQQQNE